MYKYLVYISAFFCMVACGSDFEKTATGLHFKVNKKGLGNKPKDGQIVLLNLLYKIDKGDTLFSTREQNFPAVIQYYDSAYQKDGGFMELIGMIKEGDSITIKLGAKKLLAENFDYVAPRYKLKEDAPIFIYAGLQAIMEEDSFKIWQTKKMIQLQLEAQQQAELQLKKDTQAIDNYLEEHNITAQSTESGLRYVIDQPGQGKVPQNGQKVKVNYTGRTLAGKVFDTSLEEIAKENNLYKEGKKYEPLEFSLGAHQVIRGWDEGVALLKKGAKAKFFIPSTLAYSKQAAGEHIKDNEILIFDVELVDIVTEKSPAAKKAPVKKTPAVTKPVK